MTQYFKITRKTEEDCGKELVTGLNECYGTVENWFWFVSKNDIPFYYNKGMYIREVTLPTSDGEFQQKRFASYDYHEHTLYRANKIILDERHSLDDWTTYQKFGLPLPTMNDIVDSNFFKLAKDIIETYDLYDETFPHKKNELYNYCEKYDHPILNSFTGAFKYNAQQLKDHFFQSAADIANVKMCEYLLTLGANVHSITNFTIWFHASHGNLQIIRFLVEAGVILSIDNDDPLVEASKEGHLHIVGYLVKRSPKYSIVRALSAAVKNGHGNVAKLLFKSLF